MRIKPFLLVSLLVVGGCWSGPTARVRTASGAVVEQRVDGAGRAAMERAAQEIPCTTGEMTLQPLGGGGYRVEGCGMRITYTCERAGWGVLCDPDQRESLPLPSPAHAPVAAPISVAPAAVEPAMPAPETGLQAAVRAAIDTRAPAILACVDDVALAMQVSWTRDGHLDAVLRGEREGSPEEACVRAVVRQLTVEAPGSAGTILHALQR